MKNENNKVVNPHDAFISQILRQKDEAVSLIKGILPKSMKHKVNYTSLSLSPDSYVSRQLQKTFTDIVYDGYYDENTPTKIAFIIEHKSYIPNQNIRLQLLQYFVNVTLTQLNQKNNPPALPVMVLIYHGEKPLKDEPLWRVFGNTIPEELKSFIPDFDIIISDFTTYDNEKIKTLFDSLKMRVAVFMMREIFRKDTFGITFRLVLNELLHQQVDIDIVEFLYMLMLYIRSASDEKYLEAEKIINEYKNKGEQNMETIFDVYAKKSRQEGIREGIQVGEQRGIQEGIVRGRKEGIVRGRKEGILKQAVVTVLGLYKTRSFPVDEIAQLTQLSIKQVKTILSYYKIHKENTLEYLEKNGFIDIR